MKRVLVTLVVLLGTFVCCSEKCPLEPYRETCDDLYGALYPPAGSALPVRSITVRTVGGSCGLNRDLSFCLPRFPGSGAGLLVASIRDTVPVMLGYVVPDYVKDGMGGEVPVGLGEELRSIICDGRGGVRLSAASTALGLIMANPFLGGASVQERARFASLAARHADFDNLAADVGAALVASPGDALDEERNPGLYELAMLIASHVIDLEESKLRDPSAGPYVLDAPGDYIDLINPTCVHFGVRIVVEGGVSPDTVLLITGREVECPVGMGPIVESAYLLGTGRFDIEFFKGFTGFSPHRRLDPGHAGGLATLANAEQTLWFGLTTPVGCEALKDPGSMGIEDDAWIGALADAIEADRPAEVLDLAYEYLQVHPDAAAGLIGEDVANPSDSQHYLAAARGVLAAGAARLDVAGLLDRLPFHSHLHSAVYHESLLVCQRDGVIVPCESAPMLTAGGVSPISGHTDSTFTYAVHYYDQEGQPPVSIVVVIDGEDHDMDLSEGVAADGVYEYATTLEIGLHTYHFECVDTHGDAARLPATGVLTGPEVGGYPHLTDGGVLPVDGFTRDEFWYQVTYWDPDGDSPGFVHVVVDGEAYDMELLSGTAGDGRYLRRTFLAAGCHAYYFECEDTTGAGYRLPLSGHINGPCVVYAPELSNGSVTPTVGTTETDFKFEVDYYSRYANPPNIIEVRIDADDRCAMTLKSGTPSEGTYCCETRLDNGPHTYSFYCLNVADIEAVLPDSGTFPGPMVYASGGRNADAKVAVHVRSHNPQAGCDYGTMSNCEDIVTTEPGFSFDAFPVFFDLTEYQMVEYGLTWTDWTYSAAWYDCCDVTVGEIRRPGDGVTQTWEECRSGWAAVPGYIWLYAIEPAIVCVCDHPGSGAVYVFDCSGGRDDPIWSLCAGVYGAGGDDPCPP